MNYGENARVELGVWALDLIGFESSAAEEWQASVLY